MTGGGSGYLDLFRRPSFPAYFASQTLGETGYAVYAIGVLWLALTVSHSPFVTGLVLAVEFGIYALSFLAGPWVDRVRDLRTILLIGYPLQALLAILLGVLALEGALTVPVLLVLIVALSLVWDFTWTALNALPPRLLPPGDLFRANGLASAVSGGNQIAGYAAGAGLLLIVGTPGVAMLLYGAFNVVAALAAIPLRAPAPERAPSPFLSDLREGFRYLAVTRVPPLRSLVIFSTVQGFFSAAAPLLITVLAYRSFPGGATSYSLLFTSFAIGGIGGGLLLGSLAPRRYVGLALGAATALDGALLWAAVQAAPSLWLSLPAWALVGFVDGAFYTTVTVVLQATTPEGLVGRVLGDAYLFRGTSRSAGALVLGAMAALLVPGTMGVIVALFFVAVGVGIPAALPAVRRLRF